MYNNSTFSQQSVAGATQQPIFAPSGYGDGHSLLHGCMAVVWQVTTMYKLFEDRADFNEDISGWDVRRVVRGNAKPRSAGHGF